MAATAGLCTSAAIIVALTGSDRHDTIDRVIIVLMAVTLPYWGVQGVLAVICQLPNTDLNTKTVNFKDSTKLFLMSAAASSDYRSGRPSQNPSPTERTPLRSRCHDQRGTRGGHSPINIRIEEPTSGDSKLKMTDKLQELVESHRPGCPMPSCQASFDQLKETLLEALRSPDITGFDYVRTHQLHPVNVHFRPVYRSTHREGRTLDLAFTGLATIQVFSARNRRSHCYPDEFAKRMAQFTGDGVPTTA